MILELCYTIQWDGVSRINAIMNVELSCDDIDDN